MQQPLPLPERSEHDAVAAALPPGETALEVLRLAGHPDDPFDDSVAVLTEQAVWAGAWNDGSPSLQRVASASELTGLEVDRSRREAGRIHFLAGETQIHALDFGAGDRDAIEAFCAAVARRRGEGGFEVRGGAAPSALAAALEAPGAEAVGHALADARLVRSSAEPSAARALALAVEPAELWPGDAGRGGVTLDWPSPSAVRGVRATLRGMEKTVIRRTESTGTGKNRSSRTVTYTATHTILEADLTLFGNPPEGFFQNVASGIAHLLGRGDLPKLEAGRYAGELSFTLPHDALPAHSGSSSSVTYVATVYADIPAGFDLTGTLALPVQGRPRRFDGGRGVYPPEDPGLLDKVASALMPDIRVELVVEPAELAPGRTVPARVSVLNSAGKTINFVEMVLVKRERATARGHTDNNTLQSVKAVRIEGDELEHRGGTPHSVAVVLPDDFVAYSGFSSSVWWTLEARVDVAWALDVAASVELR